MNESANLAEEYAVSKQKAVDRAVQQAEHAKITAETLRKTAEDIEKANRKLNWNIKRNNEYRYWGTKKNKYSLSFYENYI